MFTLEVELFNAIDNVKAKIQDEACMRDATGHNKNLAG